MSSTGWILIVGAIIFVIALSQRPFRIFILYMLPLVAAWLPLALGWVGQDVIFELAGAVVVAEIAIWFIRRRKRDVGKRVGKQQFRLTIPREHLD